MYLESLANLLDERRRFILSSVRILERENQFYLKTQHFSPFEKTIEDLREKEEENSIEISRTILDVEDEFTQEQNFKTFLEKCKQLNQLIKFGTELDQLKETEQYKPGIQLKYRSQVFPDHNFDQKLKDVFKIQEIDWNNYTSDEIQQIIDALSEINFFEAQIVKPPKFYQILVESEPKRLLKKFQEGKIKIGQLHQSLIHGPSDIRDAFTTEDKKELVQLLKDAFHSGKPTIAYSTEALVLLFSIGISFPNSWISNDIFTFLVEEEKTFKLLQETFNSPYFIYSSLALYYRPVLDPYFFDIFKFDSDLITLIQKLPNEAFFAILKDHRIIQEFIHRLQLIKKQHEKMENDVKALNWAITNLQKNPHSHTPEQSPELLNNIHHPEATFEEKADILLHQPNPEEAIDTLNLLDEKDPEDKKLIDLFLEKYENWFDPTDPKYQKNLELFEASNQYIKKKVSEISESFKPKLSFKLIKLAKDILANEEPLPKLHAGQKVWSRVNDCIYQLEILKPEYFQTQTDEWRYRVIPASEQVKKLIIEDNNWERFIDQDTIILPEGRLYLNYDDAIEVWGYPDCMKKRKNK